MTECIWIFVSYFFFSFRFIWSALVGTISINSSTTIEDKERNICMCQRGLRRKLRTTVEFYSTSIK